MSRCVSLNQARANASASSSGFSRKRREIFSYIGSKRSERSVVSIVGGRRSESSAGPGTVPAPTPPFGCHWCAPAGLLVSSHSWPNRFSKKPLPHWVGVAVQVTSRPDGDRVLALAGAERVLPAEAHLLDRRALGLAADVLVGVGGAVGLAERVTAGDQRDGLLVVHRHAAERLADVAGGGERVRVAVRALRVDVDQAHLHGAERLLELAVARVALVARATRSPGPSRRPRRAPTRRGARRRSRRSQSPSTPARRCR